MSTQNERRVLIVDDDAAVRALLSTVLRRRGYKVDTAPDGSDGLQRTMRCRYALILLSLAVPGTGIDEILAELGSRLPDERPMVFVLSSGPSPRHLPADLVSGTIRKPFDIQLILDSVTSCLAALPERPQLESCQSIEDEGSAGNLSQGDKLSN